MLAAEARRGPFSVLTDLIYLDLNDRSSAARSINFGAAPGVSASADLAVSARSRLRTTIWGLAAGYTVADGRWGHVDATAGFRLFSVEARSDIGVGIGVAGPGGGGGLSAGQRLKDTATLFDGVVGLRGRFNLGSGFSLPYAADIGGGSASLTWQAMGGVAYQAGPANITLDYRALHYEQSGNKLLRDAALAGPFLAASFTF